tara:strand:- start:2199 stop:2411 length:213 start_codon:yes stop_codon:yes gene_type:complete
LKSLAGCAAVKYMNVFHKRRSPALMETFLALNKAGDKKHALNSSHAIHTLLTKLHNIAKETLHEINSTMV